jgi:hypothetical protein
MDFVTLLALVLFAAMIVTWLVLPSATASAVTTKEAEATGSPVAQPQG